MINKETIREAYWIAKFGKPKRKISAEVLSRDLHLLDRPVFFLSTGRTGTLWFTQLLEKTPGIRVFHAPVPNFSIQNRFLYELWQNPGDATQKTETAKQLLLAGRLEHFRYAYKCEKRFVETNNHITFFAPVLAELIPSARFVHLYRHPGEFVRSGIRRGWYTQDSKATIKVLEPVAGSAAGEAWSSYNQIQKIAWLWNETNRFIEDFCAQHSERCLQYNFNQLGESTAEQLFEFLEIDVSKARLKRSLNTPLNVQHKSSFPEYTDWDAKDKAALKQICADLAGKYGYTL